MADFARPKKKVTVTFKTIADGTAVDITAPLLKHRLSGSAAAGADVALTRTATGTYEGEFDNASGLHRLIAGSSDIADACDVVEVAYTVPALDFPK